MMLNDRQQEAAKYITGPLLILAGAGAGKTKTITERVVEIVKSGNSVERVLCVTFTNKAAAEMRERINKRLHEEGLIDGWGGVPLIKTFHSLGLWLLRREGSALGLLKNFTILDSDDTKSIVKKILDDRGFDTKLYEPAKIRNAISREKGDFVTVSEYQNKISSYTMDVVATVWRAYEEELRGQGAVDFDDLIVRCVDLLESNQAVREKYQNFFTHVHIDEYQDTNNSQYKLSKLLVNPKNNNICVVGDTDQNIYSWRGANLRNIMNFEKDFPGTKIVLLEENYRSTGNILSLANNAIKKNTVRQEKNLFTSKGQGENIEVLPAWDEESEAEWVATKAKELIVGGVSPNEIAVLYRTNFQSRILEEMMLRNDVPYAVLGTKFFERKEVRDILSYIKCALNPKSQPDLKRVFDTPKKGIGKTTIAKLFANEELPAAAKKKVSDVFVFLEQIKNMLEVEPLSDVMNWVLVESGIEAELKDEGEDGMVRLANISELITLAQKYDELKYDENIEAFFELASLSSDQDDDKKEKNGVRLMTVHASKGLEFDHVFIVGLEEDLFPSKNFSGKNKSKEEGEEERRLFYVAVTRARKKLYLSYAEMRTIFGQRNIAPPSQFLSDIDPNATDYHDVYYKQNNGKVFYI